jgi:hypothetical protein
VNTAHLEDAVTAVVNEKEEKASVLERYATHLGKPEISRGTLKNRAILKYKEGKKKDDRKSASLLSQVDIDFLQVAIACRDKKNMGMMRKEIVQTIMDIGGAKYKSAENHYDYLIRSGRLSELKNKGKTVKARATTEKRSQICVEGQLRHFNVVESIWDEQRVFNTPVVDKRSFSFVASYFFWKSI